METNTILIWDNDKYTVRRITVEDSEGNIVYVGDDFKVKNSDEETGTVEKINAIGQYFIPANHYYATNNIKNGKIICSKKILTTDHTDRYTLEMILRED